VRYQEQWRLFIANLTALQIGDIRIVGVHAASIRVTTEAQASSSAEADEITRRLMAACNSTDEALRARLGRCEYPFSTTERLVFAPAPPPPSTPAPSPPSKSSDSSSVALAVCLTLGLLLLAFGAYICWRRNMFARCGLPYKPTRSEALELLKAAFNLRFYMVQGATPTRLDDECNFNAPAKGSFAVSRLGIVRGAPAREQRRRITEAANQDAYGARSEAGLRALEISRSSIEPIAGVSARARAAARKGKSSRRTDASGTELDESGTESTRSASPEFWEFKNATSIEAKAASEVRQQAIAYSQRARMRAQEQARRRAASEPAGPHAAGLDRKSSFMRAQRQLLQDLQKIDSSVDIATILGEEQQQLQEDNKKKTPRDSRDEAHDWLSRAMTASLMAEGPEGTPRANESALARARGRSAAAAPGSGDATSDRSKKLARARAAKGELGDRGRSLSFKRLSSLVSGKLSRESLPDGARSPGRLSRGPSFERTKTMLAGMRSNSFKRRFSKNKASSAASNAELLRAAAASYAQNHRLNSRVPGSDGLDPTTSALFEARTLNVPLPPPLISPGHSSRQEEDTAAEAEEKDETAAAAPLAASGSDSPRACCGSSETPRRQRIKTPRRPISPGRQSAVQERVGRAKADSASRAKAAGGSVDPTTINARRKLEGMAEAVQIARQRSFSRLRISRDSGGAHLKPDGSGAWVVEPAASDHCVVDMDRVSAAADHAGGAAPDIAPKPIKWRAVGADTSAAASDAIKGPSPRQNKVLSI